MKKKLLLMFILLLNCSPQTKESYLRDYEEFINKIGNESNKYSTKDWEKADKTFHKYSVELKNKFKDELIWKEQLLIEKYEIEYAMFKNAQNVKPVIKKINKIRKSLQNYSEKQMNEDIDFIEKQAEEIKDTVANTLKKIIEDIHTDD